VVEALRGPFGLDTLAASTKALESSSPGDASYTRLESLLAGSARSGTGSSRR
jgi:hypothetical protein